MPPTQTPLSQREILDSLRESAGVSVPRLAELIDRDRVHLSGVLNGRRALTQDILGRCLAALGQIVLEREQQGL